LRNEINRNIETSRFDIADYLDNKEMIAEYLNTVLVEGVQFRELIFSFFHLNRRMTEEGFY